MVCTKWAKQVHSHHHHPPEFNLSTSTRTNASGNRAKRLRCAKLVLSPQHPARHSPHILFWSESLTSTVRLQRPDSHDRFAPLAKLLYEAARANISNGALYPPCWVMPLCRPSSSSPHLSPFISIPPIHQSTIPSAFS